MSVLRAELKALGMKGNSSLEKCGVLKEESAEVASLDMKTKCLEHFRKRNLPRGAFSPNPGLRRRTAMPSALRLVPVMERVAELHAQDGPYPVIQEPIALEQHSKTDYSHRDLSCWHTTQFHYFLYKGNTHTTTITTIIKIAGSNIHGH